MRRVLKEKRKRIFEIIQIGHQEDATSRIFDYFIVTVILCNIAVLFLETFDGLNAVRGLFEGIAERSIKEAETMHQVCVTALIRGGLVVIPEDSVKVQAGDVLIYMKL